MKLPLLLSVPHSGLGVPSEVAAINLLTHEQIVRDGDEGAGEIFALEDEVRTVVTASIARAFVDVNRAEDDRRRDGVVKTHTCWDEPIYRRPLQEREVRRLLERYHRPYHAKLEEASAGVALGLDCHTMSAHAPPVSPDRGAERPLICLSDAGGACPRDWFLLMAKCLAQAFETPVSLNDPFRGGYIIRSHSAELPWMQLELSRAPDLSTVEKRARVLDALSRWVVLVGK